MNLSSAGPVSLGAILGWRVGGSPATDKSPLSGKTPECHGADKILACQNWTYLRRTLLRGACRYVHGPHAATLARTDLGRRLRARFETCGPILIEKPLWSEGDRRGPLQNKQKLSGGFPESLRGHFQTMFKSILRASARVLEHKLEPKLGTSSNLNWNAYLERELDLGVKLQIELRLELSNSNSNSNSDSLKSQAWLSFRCIGLLWR